VEGCKVSLPPKLFQSPVGHMQGLSKVPDKKKGNTNYLQLYYCNHNTEFN